MAWSIFQTGGGNSAAIAYADDLLSSLKLPETSKRVQFVYDWEKSEGGGGTDNPLNVGTFGGLASSGSQYGGGANNYPSITANIEAVDDALKSTDYKAILTNLQAKTFTYGKTSEALFASPWAGSHYGYGANWATTTPSGKATAKVLADWVTDVPGVSEGKSAAGALSDIGSFLSNPIGDIWTAAKTDIIRAFLVLVGVILMFIGISKLFGAKDSNPVTTVVEGGHQVAQKGTAATKKAVEVGAA